MALKNLMARLQCRAADTPDTPEKIMGYQRKAPIHAGCTPDTPDTPSFVDTRAIVQTGQAEQAANDSASSKPHGLETLTKPNIAAAANDSAQALALVSKQAVPTPVSNQTPVFTEPPEPPIDPNAWRELAAAYHLHHFKCSACIAAGRGPGYGLRCGTGAALWTSYQNT